MLLLHHRQALAPFVNNPSLGAVDVKETDKAYEFDVDIPGLTKDEVQVCMLSGAQQQMPLLACQCMTDLNPCVFLAIPCKTLMCT